MTVRAPLHQVTDPKEVGKYVNQAMSAAKAADPAGLLEAMGVLLNDDHWRHYVDPLDGQTYDWRDFREFVSKRLETNVERLIGALSMAPALQARILGLASAPVGVHHPDIDIVNISGGNDPAYNMRRLIKDRPDLAAQVEAGTLSVHAASVEAGFRKPTASIPVDSARSAIRALRRRFPVDELRAALDDR